MVWTNDREDDEEFKKWAIAVKVRDSYTCQICDVRGVTFESHHKNAWNSHPEERYNLDNGICLCIRCHQRFHETFGYGNNTKFQFEQYEEIAKIFKKLLESDNPPAFLSY